MHKFILHIGRHKTGTSSLQRFLNENREEMLSLGYFYPTPASGNIAHHDIAKHFARRPGPQTSAGPDILRGFFETISKSEETILLSSEAFQNANPAEVARYFAPGATKVVVYIREQVDYIVSAYQQKVHASGYFKTLDETVRPFTVDYAKFLREWAANFGAEHMIVRVYRRDRLLRGDVIADFLAAINIKEADGFKPVPGDQNPSIGGSLLEFKRFLNACNDNSMDQRRMYRAFSQLALTDKRFRKKPAIDLAKQAQIRKSVEASNREVFDKYFNGVDVFGAAAIAESPMDLRSYASEVVEIVTAIHEIDPTLHRQIRDRLTTVLPSFGNIRALKENGSTFSYSTAADALSKMLSPANEAVQ